MMMFTMFYIRTLEIELHVFTLKNKRWMKSLFMFRCVSVFVFARQMEDGLCKGNTRLLKLF